MAEWTPTLRDKRRLRRILRTIVADVETLIERLDTGEGSGGDESFVDRLTDLVDDVNRAVDIAEHHEDL